jgi:hypothetical protein
MAVSRVNGMEFGYNPIASYKSELGITIDMDFAQ